ncbi:lysostaphin resistance A-like protein [Planctomycetota bacterium]
MSTTPDNAARPVGPKEDTTFGLHAVLTYIVSLLLIIFLGSILQLYNQNLGILVTEVVFIALPAGIVLRMHWSTRYEKLFSVPRARQFSLTVVIACCASVIAVYKGIGTREALFGIDSSGTDLGGTSPHLLLTTLLLAPLCEELLFRPVIQNGLACHWHNRTSVVVTALLFALFHLAVMRFAETLVIGVFAGLVFLKTRTIWYPVLVHAICNGLGPFVWRNAQHLGFLLNPGTIIGLACLALVGCYLLGGRSPVPVRGPWQRLNWALFGTPEALETKRKRSYGLVVLTGSVMACLAVLIVGSHAVMMSRQGLLDAEADYVVSEEDEWTFASSEEIHVRSELAVKKSPETYKALIVQLPVQDATIDGVILGKSDLPFTRLEGGEYSVDLSSHQDAARSGTIAVQWSFPAASLTFSETGEYGIPVKTLVPAIAFSLTITIADGSAFQFSGDDSEVRTKRVFTWGWSSYGEPVMGFGTWVGLEKKEDKENRR